MWVSRLVSASLTHVRWVNRADTLHDDPTRVEVCRVSLEGRFAGTEPVSTRRSGTAQKLYA